MLLETKTWLFTSPQDWILFVFLNYKPILLIVTVTKYSPLFISNKGKLYLCHPQPGGARSGRLMASWVKVWVQVVRNKSTIIQMASNMYCYILLWCTSLRLVCDTPYMICTVISYCGVHHLDLYVIYPTWYIIIDHPWVEIVFLLALFCCIPATWSCYEQWYIPILFTIHRNGIMTSQWVILWHK